MADTTVTEHYVIASTVDRHGDTFGLCGQRVRLDSPPPLGSPRCERCSKAIDRIADAADYSDERCISLPAAARALNLDSLIVRECEDRVAR